MLEIRWLINLCTKTLMLIVDKSLLHPSKYFIELSVELGIKIKVKNNIFCNISLIQVYKLINKVKHKESDA
ncbi:hypothetical protein LNTAR_16463 [Lentisphaera araneosa HTCC2155]|uniref:Uncharacterized protein n=1 Tax=Lentisphaera araneosa HTCC2155 TaxID=313628 RepID=A6DQA7_9BACT|nr:hypothetical protein LNTAR_16463 [Lentisphaera araneosa HTCC2155]